MKKIISVVIFIVFLSTMAFGVPFISCQENQEMKPEMQNKTIYEKIEDLTGAKGSFDEKEGVYKVSFPRSDLKIRTAGVTMTPPMGLTVWAAFKIMGDNAMVMGDMVLLEDQVNPVMSAALENGLAVTALHNHFLWDSPKVMFMHINGSGEIEKLASAVGKVFSKIKETSLGKGDKPYTIIDPANTTLDPKKIEEIIGVNRQMTGGVFKVTIGRTTVMDGQTVGNDMGVNTWAAFVGSDERAVVDGDFAMLKSEVQSVLKALRGAGINIVALHNHMLMESPRIVFLHFWGIGATTDLAKGLKAALDTQQK